MRRLNQLFTGGGAAQAPGEKHPDHALFEDDKARGCAFFLWKEREIPAVCVENSCRAKTP